MNTMNQQKQTKPVVEHKGKYPKLSSEALILLQTQSLTWDTFCAEVSRISLAAVYLQFSQRFGWDTLSHLEISDDIPGIPNNFLVRSCDPAGWTPLPEYLGNSAEIPVADSPGRAVQKNLSRCGFLVAYRVEGLK
jgi:hypothetical protein